MKLTKSKLKQIIKEEFQSILTEDPGNCGPKPALPANWRTLPKTDPARVAWRKWFCCKKPADCKGQGKQP